jgi:glycosyltransferase involved in cell wall biosynthesis
MTTPSTDSNLILHTRVVSGAGGGPDKTILNSPRFLKDQGYPMLCAYLRDPADPQFCQLENRAQQWQAELLGVDDTGPLDWRVVGRIKILCEQRRPAIWHGHDYKTNLLGLLARRSVPMRLITTVHGWVKHTWKTPLYYAIDRRCLPRYDQVICVSQDLYDDCLARGVPAHKCWHVPNAIDTKEFSRHRTAEQSKQELGVPAGRLVIGAVGRLSAEKGFDNLIKAVAQLLAENFDIELWIAGEGDAQDSLRQLAVDLNIEDRVKLLGFRADTLELYHSMDLFALSSLREGLPNVLLEAMALEVPILTTRVAGVPKLVTDGDNGHIVEPGSVVELVTGLRSLLSDKERRNRLGAAGRRTIESKYSFANRMAKIKEIYDLTLGRDKSASTMSST